MLLTEPRYELGLGTSQEVHLSTENKIYDSLDRLSEEIARLKMEGKTIGYITGTFDIKHPGHDAFMDFAKSKCDVLVVSVTDDEFVRSNKPKGFFNQNDRCQSLSSSVFVDLIYKFSGPDTGVKSLKWVNYINEVVTKINPDIIIASSATDASFEAKKAEADLLGKKFIEYKAPPFASSTNIKDWVNTNY